MELADVIVINKADGDMISTANISASYHEVRREGDEGDGEGDVSQSKGEGGREREKEKSVCVRK
jgi:hypothetical protein